MTSASASMTAKNPTTQHQSGTRLPSPWLVSAFVSSTASVIVIRQKSTPLNALAAHGRVERLGEDGLDEAAAAKHEKNRVKKAVGDWRPQNVRGIACRH